MLNTTADDVYHRLRNLSKHGIIHYIPRKKTPYVIYTINREETERVVISKEIWEDRLERNKKRVEAMLNYATDNQVCRSRQLLMYFGQKDSGNCGHCDVCLSKNELGISRYEYDKIQNEFMEKLADGPCLDDELIDSFPGENNRKLKVLRHLCDEGKIQHNLENHTFFK
jgi:ATP-dependent DNA helicase RecQ